MIKEYGCFLGCLIILIVIGIVFIEGALFMFLFNWLTPLFWPAAPELTFLQSVGILFFINFLGNLLFKQIQK